jgi:hypothetical protein
MVWVHEYGIGESTTALTSQGTTISQADEEVASVSLALNSGIGKLRDEDLIYGTPVYVISVNNELHIHGLAGYLAAEYTHRVVVRPQRSINLAQLDIGLLQPATPPDMTVFISGFTTVAENTVYRVPNLVTDELGSYVPDTSGKALGLMVEVDPVTALLTITAGPEFDFDPDIGFPTHEQAFDLYYPKTVASDSVLLGYVRLYQGIASITVFDLYAAQEVIGRGGGLGEQFVTYKNEIITYDGEALTYG